MGKRNRKNKQTAPVDDTKGQSMSSSQVQTLPPQSSQESEAVSRQSPLLQESTSTDSRSEEKTTILTTEQEPPEQGKQNLVGVKSRQQQRKQVHAPQQIAQVLVQEALNQPKAPVPKQQLQQSGSQATSKDVQGEIQMKSASEKCNEQPLELAEKKNFRTGGRAGKPIALETNYLGLDLGNLTQAFHYDVAIKPEKQSKAVLNDVVEKFGLKYYPDVQPVFDGAKNLYSPSELPFGEQSTGEVTLQFEDGKEKKYELTVKFAACINLSKENLELSQDAIQCINIVLQQAASQPFTRVGRNFFSMNGCTLPVAKGMEMYNGFFQSAVVGWKPLVNVDVVHKAFLKPQKVLDFVHELFGQGRESLSASELQRLDRCMRNIRIQYEIPNRPSLKRKCTINGLRGSADQESFTNTENKVITVADYYSAQYGYSLLYPKMPCLWVGDEKRTTPILLPLELCTIREGQVPDDEDLLKKSKSNIIKHVAKNPEIRKEKIMDAVSSVNYNNNRAVKAFDFSVKSEFEKVEGRVIDPPQIQYRDNGTVTPKNGAWSNFQQKFVNAVQIQKWAVFCIDTTVEQSTVQNMIDMFVSCGTKLGMHLKKPVDVSRFELPPAHLRTYLNKYFTEKKLYDLIVMIIPDVQWVYNSVKQTAELSTGSLTQCVKAKTVKGCKISIIRNILLKVNAKLNGWNQALIYSRPSSIKGRCMVMGADVTHPPPGSKNKPSIAAVTASHDSDFFQYNFCWGSQQPTKEIIENLQTMVQERIEFFRDRNKEKPEKIIFFRDGVSEGQFKSVLNEELRAIQRACFTVGGATYKPPITFVVVQKRHHTRFFPIKNKKCNAPAGTVVDTVITHPRAQDMYLLSHTGPHGVARPTRYRTLWDDNMISDDEMMQLTYYLCHMSTRCNKSISYPAPTYYAHLAAARAMVYCSGYELNLDCSRSRRTVKEAIIKRFPMFFV